MNSIVTGEVVKGSDCFIVDWFSFSTRIFDPLDPCKAVIDLLGLSDCPFTDMPYGFRYYRKRKDFAGIKICYDACINGKTGEQMDNEGTVYVEMSGQACRAFETYSSHKSFLKLFRLCVEDPENYHCSRLDIAYDDWSGSLDIDVLAAYSLAQNVVTPFRSGEVTKASLYSGRHRPQTVYFGSRTSDIRLRFYNKAAERQRDDVDHWIRAEVQLRDERAFKAIDTIVAFQDVSLVVLGILNEYLRFVEPSEDTNRSRWETASWWAAFLDRVDKVKLITQKSIKYNYLNVRQYVYTNCARAIRTIIQVDGGDKLLRELQRSKSDPMDVPKYAAIIREMEYFKKVYGGDVVDVDPDCINVEVVWNDVVQHYPEAVDAVLI